MKIVALHGPAGSGKSTIADWFVKQKHFVELALADPIKNFILALWGHPDSGNTRASLINCLWGPSNLRAGYIATAKPDNDCLLPEMYIFKMLPEEKQMEAANALDTWIRQAADRRMVPLRELLQTLGTEWGRNRHPTIWIDHLLNVRIPAVQRGAYFNWSSEFGPWPDTVKGVIVPDVRFDNEWDVFLAKGPLFDIHRWGERRQSRSLTEGIEGHASEQGVKKSGAIVLNLPDGLDKMPHYLEAVYQRFVGL